MMAKQRVEIEVDVPELFAVDGIGDVETDQWFIGRDGLPQIANYYFPGPFVRLKKVEPVRESRWLNLYDLNEGVGEPHPTRTQADHCKRQNRERKGVIRIDYENARPVAASIE